MASILIDGDCEQAGTTRWATFSGASLTKDTSSPHGGTQALRLTAGSAATGGCYPNGAGAFVGGVYSLNAVGILSGWARGDGTSVPRVSQVIAGGGDTTVWTGSSSTTWQNFSVSLHSALSSVWFYLRHTVGGIGHWVEFDDLSLDITGGYAEWLPQILSRRR